MRTIHTDALVVGSGIAGLRCALQLSHYGSVVLVSKDAVHESNTYYAQGGIAAALFSDDSPSSHIDDTLIAGDGLCDADAVRVLCEEGPDRVRELLALGVAFDRDASGVLLRGREAAHACARVVHAGGDATGRFTELGLVAAVQQSAVHIYEHARLQHLIVKHGTVCGANFLSNTETFSVRASATVLATGGAGRLYAHTTNPAVATGDGVAAAFRAGALIKDAEMYQFHPTLLAAGSPALISEALRGEGAVLRNSAGERFMLSYHRDAELAPRDIVARAIANEMALQDGEPVLLDATCLDAAMLRKRFPTIDRSCQLAQIDFATTPIPVTPAAHFWMGGIATDLWGRTSLQGLYAVGEAACTGVHGANRLASNSLLEGLVFGQRTADVIGTGTSFSQYCPKGDDEIVELGSLPCSPYEPASIPAIDDIARTMWDHVGLVRDYHGLRIAEKQFAEWESPVLHDENMDVMNLLQCARLIATSAITRSESRGAHARDDFPLRNPAWLKHILMRKA